MSAVDDVVAYVADHPGCTKTAAADAAWHGKYGWQTVDAAINTGLITAEWRRPDNGGAPRWHLYVVGSAS